MKAAVFIAAVLGLFAPARADWFDPQWTFRRALDVNWDAQRAVGGELATADFYTSGHDSGNGDIRIATEDGHPVASHLLTGGQGDLVHVVFALAKGQSKYYAYFGNPNPAPAPAALQQVQYKCGLLMEMKAWQGVRPTSGNQLIMQWEASGPVIGEAMINQPFYLEDPLTDGPRRIFKLSGNIFSPGTGEYYFSGSVIGAATLYIDGKLVLFIPTSTRSDAYHATCRIQAGHHDFVVYYFHPSVKGQLAIDWRLANQKNLEAIPKTAFGMLGHARTGALEQFGKTLIADFDSQFEGECGLGDDYSYRYLFTARVPANFSPAAPIHFDWDFGDGITAGGTTMEHVFVNKGVYPVRVTIRAGDSTDTQTTRFWVDRERDDSANQDTPLEQGRILARYDVSKVPEPWLAPMALVERDALMSDAELAAARRMTGIGRHANPEAVKTELIQIVQDLERAGRAKEAVDLLDPAPTDADLQPTAAAMESEALVWWLGDFSRALKVTERVADSYDPAGRRAHAEAMILTGSADDGRKILDDLQDTQAKAGVRIEAESGAWARNLEFRLDEKDVQTGEDEWNEWDQRCPAAFMVGESVLLRTELLEQRGALAVAAKIDEAFATAVPNSPYAPELLERAAKAMDKIDPAKAAELRDLLKSRYPEVPTTQNSITPPAPRR